LRNSLLRRADEYAARAGDQEDASENGSENDDTAVWQAGSDNKGAD
jgi:hypothetical protein